MYIDIQQRKIESLKYELNKNRIEDHSKETDQH